MPFSFSEPELSWREGCNCRAVQNRADSWPSSYSLGRCGQAGTAAEAAGRGHPHVGMHTQRSETFQRENKFYTNPGSATGACSALEPWVMGSLSCPVQQSL